MHDQGGPMPGGADDNDAYRRRYDAMATLHKQMFETQLQARERILAVLTPEQRQRLAQSDPYRGGPPR
jgi:Spy/CpxP family protein refolding chaperone